MVVLGIDPGSRLTGYGVIQVNERGQSTYVASGCIRMSQKDLGQRLEEVHQGITQLIAQYQPDALAIEEVFVHKYAKAALVLGHVRGVALLALRQTGQVVGEYAPRRIKQAVVGYGAADKEQIRHMIKALLHLEGLPSVDAADALAIALCHVHHSQLDAQLKVNS